MDSARDIHCWMGCPIRRSRDQRALASTPGFSQRATSFIASRCQGIHQMPLPQRLIARNPSLAETSSAHNKPSREDTHPKKPEARTQKAKPAPAFDIHTSSAFTESHPNHRHHADSRKRLRLTPSSLCQRSRRKGPRPPAQTRHSRSLYARPAVPLSPRKRAAAAACDFGCAETLRSRGSRRTINRSRGGGGDRNRTDDLLLAKQALSQLSYTPQFFARQRRAKILKRRQRLRSNRESRSRRRNGVPS